MTTWSSSKETYWHYKRDLLTLQKRPSCIQTWQYTSVSTWSSSKSSDSSPGQEWPVRRYEVELPDWRYESGLCPGDKFAIDRLCVSVCARACVCVCVRACVRACACVWRVWAPAIRLPATHPPTDSTDPPKNGPRIRIRLYSFTTLPRPQTYIHIYKNEKIKHIKIKNGPRIRSPTPRLYYSATSPDLYTYI